MTIKRKTNITLLVLLIAVLLSIFFVVNPTFNQIKKESQNLIIQKKGLIESEAKIKNLQDFRVNFKRYQPNLEKIDQLFISISEPIDFIEFLENEAVLAHISIIIAPPTTKEKNSNFWPALEFNLNLKGSFQNFLKFLDRLQSSSYLIEPINMSVSKISNTKDEVSITLLIKTYAK